MSFFRDVIVVAGLEGNLEGVRQLISKLPPVFPASILVALQVPSDTLELDRALAKDSALPFLHAHEGQKILKGYVYLGSPYANLVARPWGALGLEPAIANDRLHTGIERCFDSVANVWGNRVIGVLLSQNDKNTMSGLATIKSNGGVAIVQTSSKELLLQTPQHEIEWNTSHYEMPFDGIAALLISLTGMPAPTIFTRLSRKMRSRMIYGF